MWTELRRVARRDVELLRRLRDLREHELRVEEDGVVLDPLAGLAEQLQRTLGHELDADLGHEPPPRRRRASPSRRRTAPRSAASCS